MIFFVDLKASRLVLGPPLQYGSRASRSAFRPVTNIISPPLTVNTALICACAPVLVVHYHRGCQYGRIRFTH